MEVSLGAINMFLVLFIPGITASLSTRDDGDQLALACNLGISAIAKRWKKTTESTSANKQVIDDTSLPQEKYSEADRVGLT